MPRRAPLLAAVLTASADEPWNFCWYHPTAMLLQARLDQATIQQLLRAVVAAACAPPAWEQPPAVDAVPLAGQQALQRVAQPSLTLALLLSAAALSPQKRGAQAHQQQQPLPPAAAVPALQRGAQLLQPGQLDRRPDPQPTQQQPVSPGGASRKRPRLEARHPAAATATMAAAPAECGSPVAGCSLRFDTSGGGGVAAHSSSEDGAVGAGAGKRPAEISGSCGSSRRGSSNGARADAATLLPARHPHAGRRHHDSSHRAAGSGGEQQVPARQQRNLPAPGGQPRSHSGRRQPAEHKLRVSISVSQQCARQQQRQQQQQQQQRQQQKQQQAGNAAILALLQELQLTDQQRACGAPQPTPPCRAAGRAAPALAVETAAAASHAGAAAQQPSTRGLEAQYRVAAEVRSGIRAGMAAPAPPAPAVPGPQPLRERQADREERAAAARSGSGPRVDAGAVADNAAGAAPDRSSAPRGSPEQLQRRRFRPPAASAPLPAEPGTRQQLRSRAGGRQQPAPGRAAQLAGCKAGGSIAEPATKYFADEAVSDLRQPQPQTPRSIAARLGEPPRSRVSPLQFSGVRQETHVELHVGQDGELCSVPAHRF